MLIGAGAKTGKITSPFEWQVGDIVLFDGAGPAFRVLSWLLGRFDPVWKKAPRKPWHTAFLSRYDSRYVLGQKGYYVPGWMVSEAKGGVGITESRLADFKESYLVFRWFDTPPDKNWVQNFIVYHQGEKYDSFWGYFFVICWYFIKRFPLIRDKNWMCWEFVYLFCEVMGKPLDDCCGYPLITIMMKKLGYPGY
jgi:hypothetical protein